MSRVAPYGGPRGSSLSEADEAGLRAVGVVLAEVDQLRARDPDAARRLGRELLAFLLGPRGRGLLPSATHVVACLLARPATREVVAAAS